MRIHPIVPGIVLALAIVRYREEGASWLTWAGIAVAALWLGLEVRKNWLAQRASENSDAPPQPSSPPVRTPEQTRELLAAVDRVKRMRADQLRPPPPLPGEAEILATAKPAILVRRTDLPVPLDHPSRSYIGGLPRLPTELAWPTIEKYERYSLTFLAQIDLAELPALESSPLPRSGTLFFFADMTDEAPEPSDCRVLYYAGDTARVPIRDLPTDIRPYGDTPPAWFDEESLWARTGFRFPIEFAVFDSYRDYTVEEGSRMPPRRNREAFRKLMGDEYTRRFGAHEPAPGNAGKVLAQDRDEWPFAWVAVEYGARVLADTVRSATARQPAEVLNEFQPIADAAQKWIDRASKEAPCTRIDEETRAAFLAEWRELAAGYGAAAGRHRLHPRRLDDRLFDVVVAACHTCATHGATDLVPPIYRDALRYFNDPVVNFPMHQVLGHGEKVQWAPIEHAHQELLLQFIGDLGLGWHTNGGCALQFWVDPAAARRADFDAVELTLECD
jgi:hypothetical protein